MKMIAAMQARSGTVRGATARSRGVAVAAMVGCVATAHRAGACQPEWS
jgi:hypothetical protein